MDQALRTRPQNGQKKNYLQKGGYTHDTYSAKLLVGAAALNLLYFDGQGEQLGIDYRPGNNPFDAGRGAVIALNARILAPSGATFKPTVTAELDASDAVSELFEGASFEIKRGSLVVHRGSMSSLLGPRPEIYKPLLENSSTPANIVRPGSAILPHREFAEARIRMYPIVFKTPLNYDDTSIAMKFSVVSNNGFPIPAILNNHILKIESLFLEYPKVG